MELRLALGLLGASLVACAALIRRSARGSKLALSLSDGAIGTGTASSPRVAASEAHAKVLRKAWAADPDLVSFTGVHMSQPFEYHDGALTFSGRLDWAEGGCLKAAGHTRRPGVLLVHTAVGPHDLFLHWRAQNLAARGYVVYTVDLLGDETGAGWDPSWAAPRRQIYVDDRPLLGRRMRLAMEALCASPLVDPSRVAALGFCFGGRAVLDLLRAQPPAGGLRGVVSFHGILDALPAAGGPRTAVKARALICHADADPFVPPEALAACLEQLRTTGCDWQLLSFGGGTLHGFTNPAQALNPAKEFDYDARAAYASWEAARRFLREILD